MADSRRNVVKRESPYGQSQDFLNIDEPPAAKETPDVSEYDLSDDNEPRSFGKGYNNYNYADKARYGTSQAPTRGLRRRSSNYMDALNQQLSERSKVSDSEYPNFARRKSSTLGMDPQDTRHDLETKMVGKCSDKFESVPAGDSFEQTRRKDAPSFFKDSYLKGEKPERPTLSNPENGDYYRSSYTSKGNQQSGLDRRKSSFAYEDYKKDVYNKMNMFDND